MKDDYTVSETTGLRYDPKKMVRLVNQRQCALYMLHGVTLYDMYATRDFKTGDPILVYLFSKEETRKLYELWVAHELK